MEKHDRGYRKGLAHAVVQLKSLKMILYKVTYTASTTFKLPLPVISKSGTQYQKLRYFDAIMSKDINAFTMQNKK